jgi:AcrR family transcriptional regulator
VTRPKKPALPKARKVRGVVPSAEAQKLLIDAAIEMLRVLPFDQVTARAITKKVGLSLPTISNNFGSMAGLFNEATIKLRNDVLARTLGNILDQSIFLDPDFILRTRLVAWLTLEGENPGQFNNQLIESIAPQFQTALGGLSLRTTTAWLTLIIFMVEGYAIFSEVHEYPPAQIADSLSLFTELREQLQKSEKNLGWKN